MTDDSVAACVQAVLRVLEDLGVPTDGTERARDRQAKALMALMDVRATADLSRAKPLSQHGLKTREIIDYWNEHLGEKISKGGYDEIRRRDLKMASLAGVAIQPDNLAKNSPARTWGVHELTVGVFRSFGTPEYRTLVREHVLARGRLVHDLEARRNLERIEVRLPDGHIEHLAGGDHDDLIRATIEEFLPRYGYGAQVVYFADAANRSLYFEKELADRLGLPSLDDGNLLPDVIAYSRDRDWLYLIEAVHSAGAISAAKRLQLARRFRDSNAPLLYVTVFAKRDEVFRKFVGEIGWETEVWIASEPDHVIHFNGERFLGPYD